jgi:hypothetical protein
MSNFNQQIFHTLEKLLCDPFRKILIKPKPLVDIEHYVFFINGRIDWDRSSFDHLSLCGEDQIFNVLDSLAIGREKICYINDGSFDGCIEFYLKDAFFVIKTLLEQVPLHHYFYSANGSWCISIVNGYIDFGHLTRHRFLENLKKNGIPHSFIFKTIEDLKKYSCILSKYFPIEKNNVCVPSTYHLKTSSLTLSKNNLKEDIESYPQDFLVFNLDIQILFWVKSHQVFDFISSNENKYIIYSACFDQCYILESFSDYYKKFYSKYGLLKKLLYMLKILHQRK